MPEEKTDCECSRAVVSSVGSSVRSCRRLDAACGGRVVSIFEDELTVVAELALVKGDPIEMIIEPRSGVPVEVSAIVCDDDSASPSGRSSRIRKLLCDVSAPSLSFLELVDALDPSSAEPGPLPNSRAHPVANDCDFIDPDLPCSRKLEPSHRTGPGDSISRFRVRLHQSGGPRTRMLTLRARSAIEAERIALQELGKLDSGAMGWDIRHVVRVDTV